MPDIPHHPLDEEDGDDAVEHEEGQHYQGVKLELARDSHVCGFPGIDNAPVHQMSDPPSSVGGRIGCADVMFSATREATLMDRDGPKATKALSVATF